MNRSNEQLRAANQLTERFSQWIKELESSSEMRPQAFARIAAIAAASPRSSSSRSTEEMMLPQSEA
jgi:hypothetical protein